MTSIVIEIVIEGESLGKPLRRLEGFGFTPETFGLPDLKTNPLKPYAKESGVSLNLCSASRSPQASDYDSQSPQIFLENH
jgi:hypothetical protein